MCNICNFEQNKPIQMGTQFGRCKLCKKEAPIHQGYCYYDENGKVDNSCSKRYFASLKEESWQDIASE